MKSRWRGQRVSLLALVIVALVSAAAAMAASRWVKSPQEVAASRRAPAASVLTAEVEYRVLEEKLVTRGDVVVGQTFDVAFGGTREVTAVVTAVRTATGRSVPAGHVVAEVSGRPLFVLTGSIPAYRDLKPGATGKDVAQLQSALAALGFGSRSDAKGTLGPGTQAALTAFYSSIGYSVPTNGDGSQVTAARSSVTSDRRALDAAQRALSRLKATGSASSDDLEDAKIAVTYATEDLTAAKAALSNAQASSGPMLPLGEVAFIPRLPARVAKLSAKLGATADGSAVTLDLGNPRITLRLDADQRAVVRVGMGVTALIDENLDWEISCHIDRIGSKSNDSNDGVGYAVTVTCPKGLPRSAVGENVRITATTASTSRAVLVVPLSAVTSSADGSSVVMVRKSSSHRSVRVVVKAGISAAGFVEVTPSGTGSLKRGDRVVVGK